MLTCGHVEFLNEEKTWFPVRTSSEVVDHYPHLQLLHLVPVRPRSDVLPVSPLQDGEGGLYEVPPVVEVLIECPGELPTVLSVDPLPPPVPDRDQRGGPELLPDLPVQILGIVPLVQDIDGRSPGPVAPGEERPRMDDIVTEVSRYPEAGDHLFIGIDRD